jgi:hypothetical protein
VSEALDIFGVAVEIDAEDAARIAAAEAALLARQVAALARAMMPPGCWDKRFVRDVAGRDAATLTDKQKAAVQRLLWKYRRQLPKHLVPTVDPADPLATDYEAGRFRPASEARGGQ